MFSAETTSHEFCLNVTRVPLIIKETTWTELINLQALVLPLVCKGKSILLKAIVLCMNA